MKVFIKEISKNKKRPTFTIKFNIEGLGFEKVTNWISVYTRDGNTRFGDVIYQYHPGKIDIIKKNWKDYMKGTKYPDPRFYYNMDLTEELLTLIYKTKEFQQFKEEYKFKMYPEYLFYKTKIKQREKRLKKIIRLACERNEYIGAILPEAYGYVPLNAIDPGWEIFNRLPGGDDFEVMLTSERNVEKLLSLLDSACENVEWVKYLSFIGYYVSTTGEIFDNLDVIGNNPFPNEVHFFDELFSTETFPRLAEQIIDKEQLDFLVFEKEDISNDKYYISDRIIYDVQSIFKEYQSDLIDNKEQYKKQIIEYWEEE